MRPTLNQLVKDSIAQALFKLLEKRDFAAITITEITQTAGVSRVSFYRNYTSKEDVLMKQLWEKMERHFVGRFQNGKLSQSDDIFTAVFEFAAQEALLVDLIYRHKLSHLILTFIRDCRFDGKTEGGCADYRHAVMMGIVFGALDEWIRCGRRESEQEMAQKIIGTLREIVGRESDS